MVAWNSYERKKAKWKAIIMVCLASLVTLLSLGVFFMAIVNYTKDDDGILTPYTTFVLLTSLGSFVYGSALFWDRALNRLQYG